MLAAQGGDEAALCALLRRHASRLLGFLVKRLGSRADSEEVLQEIFLEAWRDLEKFDAGRSSARSWLFLLARSRALDRVRSSRARDGRESRYADDRPANFDPRSREVARATVERALETLSDEQRTCVRLAFYDGLSLSQVSTALELPLGTVKSRYRYGMQALRSRFAR